MQAVISSEPRYLPDRECWEIDLLDEDGAPIGHLLGPTRDVAELVAERVIERLAEAVGEDDLPLTFTERLVAEHHGTLRPWWTF